jgi:hypothetical protein
MKFLLRLLFLAQLCDIVSAKEAEENVGEGLKITAQMRQAWEAKESTIYLEVKLPPPLWEKWGRDKSVLSVDQARTSCKTEIKTSGSLVTIMKVLEGDHTNLGVGLKYFFRVRVFYC